MTTWPCCLAAALMAAEPPADLTFWIVLWKIVLIGGLLLFAGLAVGVTIGGFFDARRLFAKLAEAHREEQQAEGDQPT